MFTSIIDKSAELTVGTALICTAASLVLGLVIACVYMFRNRSSRNYCVALVLLPVIVQIVIMMVDGQLGTGVAVMGAFSLVRFRSAPGNAKDICCIFFAMAVGLATGLGYVTFAACATLVISLVLLLLTATRFGGRDKEYELRLTVPENMDYVGAFDAVFDEYADSTELVRVKSADSGCELRYRVTLKGGAEQKKLIDALRGAGCGQVVLAADESRSGETAL